ncbi:hypothetical protein LR48_Vigan86s000900 [Vigna angularis]|uniref:Uncharacterized protein n=1 Tax=Phaseolus angularis TaxID=3914 RepID=A0A0L9T3V9_PHAAN|nr:hypothetical protein LR48_Vigan86s000900 [Vigna angularis]
MKLPHHRQDPPPQAPLSPAATLASPICATRQRCHRGTIKSSSTAALTQTSAAFTSGNTCISNLRYQTTLSQGHHQIILHRRLDSDKCRFHQRQHLHLQFALSPTLLPNLNSHRQTGPPHIRQSIPSLGTPWSSITLDRSFRQRQTHDRPFHSVTDSRVFWGKKGSDPFSASSATPAPSTRRSVLPPRHPTQFLFPKLQTSNDLRPFPGRPPRTCRTPRSSILVDKTFLIAIRPFPVRPPRTSRTPLSVLHPQIFQHADARFHQRSVIRPNECWVVDGPRCSATSTQSFGHPSTIKNEPRSKAVHLGFRALGLTVVRPMPSGYPRQQVFSRSAICTSHGPAFVLVVVRPKAFGISLTVDVRSLPLDHTSTQALQHSAVLLFGLLTFGTSASLTFGILASTVRPIASLMFGNFRRKRSVFDLWFQPLDNPCQRAFKHRSTIHVNERSNTARQSVSTSSIQTPLDNPCVRVFKHRSTIHVNERSDTARQSMSNERSNTARQSMSTSIQTPLDNSCQRAFKHCSTIHVNERSNTARQSMSTSVQPLGHTYPHVRPHSFHLFAIRLRFFLGPSNLTARSSLVSNVQSTHKQ